MQLAQLLGQTSEGAPIIRSSARWFIGNSTTSRRFSSAHNSMTMRSMPGAMPPCGGAPQRERAQHAAEFLLERVLAVAGHGEGFPHDVGTMIADRTRG